MNLRKDHFHTRSRICSRRETGERDGLLSRESHALSLAGLLHFFPPLTPFFHHDLIEGILVQRVSLLNHEVEALALSVRRVTMRQ